MPSVAKTSNISNVNNNKYMQNGITISPSIPSIGETAKISYDGILSKSGATHVYAHIGYGSKWDNSCDLQMTKTSSGFEVNVPVNKPDVLNVCFKDCANNWDNNSGKNYMFEVM